MEAYDPILKFWFGRVEETIVPTENRARIWFGESPEVDVEIRDRFQKELDQASKDKYQNWLKNPRGQLASIILMDQFSRHVYRNSARAFELDARALDVCLNGISQEDEHSLSLIERVFYYFPLLHSEKLIHQEQSVHAYRILTELAFSETRVIYDSFLKFANHHYNIIQRFGRFPQRNQVLGRESTPEELHYLHEIEEAS